MDIPFRKIALIGATGLIGKAVCAHLGRSYELTVFRRRNAKIRDHSDPSTQTYSSLQELTRLLAETDYGAIINLAGEPVAGKRWSAGQKQIIRDSRILTTRAVAEAIAHTTVKPRLLINASATGFYGETGEQTADENSPPGNDFLSRVCADWENEALKARQANVRVVLLRFGIVLGNGGALEKIKFPFQWFAGGPVGSGKQWMSWIHIDDVSRIIEFCLQNADIQGPVNCVSPGPIRMGVFAGMLGKILRRPSCFRIPAWTIRTLLGERASLLLASQKVFPEKLTALRFPFLYQTAEAALTELLDRPR